MTTVSKLRHVIREALDKQSVVNRLQAIAASKKPYMHGQWQPAPRDYTQGGGLSDSWVAEDPELGKVYLTFSSHVTYKKVKDSRLRDPNGTRYSYYAILSTYPRETLPSYNNALVFKHAVTGEGKEDKKVPLVRKQMVKLFGIDPLAYKGPIEPVKEMP
jgi:hypothetical protein